MDTVSAVKSKNVKSEKASGAKEHNAPTNMNYVIESGGKQYLTSQGKILVLPRIKAEIGDIIDLKVVSSVANVVSLDPMDLKAEVKEHKRGKKVITFKKIRRHGYEKKKGHRTDLTVVRVL